MTGIPAIQLCALRGDVVLRRPRPSSERYRFVRTGVGFCGGGKSFGVGRCGILLCSSVVIRTPPHTKNFFSPPALKPTQKQGAR